MLVAHRGSSQAEIPPPNLEAVAPVENPETASSVASLIDHTLLKPDATRDDILRLCAEAREFAFASVCVNPCWVPVAADALAGCPVRTCTVIGFPLGANAMRTKVFETELALSQGAQEIDMVQNVGVFLSGDLDYIGREIGTLAGITHSQSMLLKVILETSLLSVDQIRTACELALAAKADFVKTSTGFSARGATVDDVRLMRNTVGPKTGVKASGGIRSLAALLDMTRAGASRIGTSSGVAIVREFEQLQNADQASMGVNARDRSQDGY